MSIASAIARFFGYSASTVNGSSVNYAAQVSRRVAPVDLPARDLYNLLLGMYLTNGVYDELRLNWAATGAMSANLKAIRNPVSAVVNTLGSRLYPEPLIVTTPLTAGVISQQERQDLEANDPIKAAIDQVHDWSNWERASRKHARWCALYGEAFTKIIVSPERGRVYFELIESQYVTDYTLDERDYITMCRLDILQTEDTDSGMRTWTHVEVWDRDLGSVRYWRPEGDVPGKKLRDLGPPVEEIMLSEFGIDFVPIVRAPFREINDGRAIGAVQLALEAIIEADLSATNLHGMLYQDAEGAWVLKSVGSDGNSRPQPAPRVADATADGRSGRQSDGSVMIGKRSFWTLPGDQELQSVVANIDYAAALAILQDQMLHLERLMPALAYIRISEMGAGDLSGRAINYKMRPFAEQVMEARANLLASLFQADCMALTMGAAAGIPGFENLGSFENGDFQHSFTETPILPPDTMDEAQEKLTLAQAATNLQSAGVPLSYILTNTLGLTEQEATEIIDAEAQVAEQAFNQQLDLAAAQPAPAANGGQFGGGNGG